MTTRDQLRSELATRLGDSAFAVWPSAELDGFLNYAIKGLYPSYYQRKVASTTTVAGPVQTAPTNARNLYLVGHQRQNTIRVRNLRGWADGGGTAYLPKALDAGDTLVWAWTTAYDAPATGAEQLVIPAEAEEVVVLRAQITALEKLLSDRVSVDKYHALQVRQGVTEDDIANTLDALHASLRDRLSGVLPLPEVIR